MGTPRTRRTKPGDAAAAPLVAALREEYAREYGDLLGNEFELYDAAEFRPPLGTFVLLRARGQTLAGGALRRWADGIGEIKRMWTHPAHRGQGYGRRVLATLERAAVDLGYGSVRLETAVLQAAAVALYRSAGYRPIPAHGRDAADARFVYLEKRLVP